MPTVKDEVAKNLLYYRKKNRMTQKHIAECLGVKHNAVSSWENGANSIDIELLFKICEIFKISVNDMYGIYSNSQAEHFTKEEKELLRDYQMLNNQGKEYIRQTMVMALSTYKKADSVPGLDTQAKLG